MKRSEFHVWKTLLQQTYYWYARIFAWPYFLYRFFRKKITVRTIAIILLGLLGGGVIIHYLWFPFIPIALADNEIERPVATLLANIIYYVVVAPLGVLSAITAWFLELLIGYPWNSSVWKSITETAGGGFVSVASVKAGWVIVRDVCNIFFSLILAIIAFATVLKIEAYSWKQMLPKLVLMAVLINFSKSIAGIFTDLATVVMATFGNNLVEGSLLGGMLGAFGISQLTSGLVEKYNATTNEKLDAVSTADFLLTFIAAAIFMLVFFVVTVVFSLTLVFRIGMLWFLIVLSPLAYITRILPQTQKYSGQWWEMFGRYVVVGPLVTFFIWLSLSMIFNAEGNPVSRGAATAAGSAPGAATLTPATDPSYIVNFLVATMILMASLKIIHQMASEFGGILSKVEQGAWEAGGGLMKFGPQWLQGMTGGTIGKVVSELGAAYGKDKKWQDKYGAATGKVFSGLTALTGTLLQPTHIAKGIYGAIKKTAKEREENAWYNAGERLKAIDDIKIVDPEKSGGAFWWQVGKGLLASPVGFLGIMGTHPETFIKDYMSPGALTNRLLPKWGRILLFGATGEVRQAEHESQHANDKKDEATKRLTDAEKKQAEADKNDIKQAIDEEEKIQKDLDGTGLSGTVLIDFRNKSTQGAVDNLLDQFAEEKERALAKGDYGRATEIEDAIKTLKHQVENNNFDVQESNFKAGILAKVYTDPTRQADALKKFKDDAKSISKDSVLQQNKDYDEATKRLDFTTMNGGTIAEKDREQAIENAQKKKQIYDNLKSKFASYEVGESFEARVHDDHLESEEYKKVQGLLDSAEVYTYVLRAKREKNAHLYRAAWRRLFELGDENEYIQQEMSVDVHGQWDPLAISNGVGLENFRRKKLIGEMGMTADASMRMASDLGYIAEQHNHFAMGRKYGFAFGERRVLCDKIESQRTIPNPNRPGSSMPNPQYRSECDPGVNRFANPTERTDLLATERLKGGSRSFASVNRLGWAGENYLRKFEADEFTLKVAQFAGADLADQRVWNNMTPNAKFHLSNPEVTNYFAKNGVNADFINKLRNYWATVGRFQQKNVYQSPFKRRVQGRP